MTEAKHPRIIEKNTDYPNLLEFWKMRRMVNQQPCVIKPFHVRIARSLTEMVLGKLPEGKSNLMILMPPRCAKTDLCVRTFIPWAMSYYGDAEFITSSYSSDLSTDSVIDIRNTLSAEWYRNLLDSHRREGLSSVYRWGAHVQMRGEQAGGRQDYFKTREGGSVKATGRGGGIIGFGAGKLRDEFGGAIVIDDLLKAQEARSTVARKEAIAYYTGGLKPRRNRQDNPKTPVILIMQRLHPEDLAGYILREERDEWVIVQIPAHDDTETVWPGRINYDEMMKMRDANPDDYWSQYMQNPQAAATQILKRAYWRYWDDITKVNKLITLKIITADTAFKAADANDWTVFQCWGLWSGGMFLLDQDRKRYEFPALVDAAEAFWAKHSARTHANIAPASEFWIEDKASGQSLIQVLRKRHIPARAWSPDEDLKKYVQTRKGDLSVGINASKDKVGRAQQCTMPLSTGRVFIPDPRLQGYAWVDGFLAECEAFTSDDSHLFDDQVDTFTEACLLWQTRGGGSGAIPKVAPRIRNNQEMLYLN